MARREWQDPSILERESSAGREYYIRYRVKVLEMEAGKPVIKRVEKWRSLGLCAEMTKRQAEREKDRIMREVNGQVYTVQSQVPFAAFAKIFDENHVAFLATPTQNNYRQQMRTHILPAFQGMKLCEVGPLKVQQLFRLLESAGIAKTTRNTIRGVLSALFKCARKWRYMETPSPTLDLDIGGGPKRIRPCKVPTLEQVQMLMAECDGDIPLLIETLYTTGMRISEAAGLIVSDLDFGQGRINVRRRNCRGDIGDTKSDAGFRDLPMGAVLKLLRKHIAGKAPTDPVFTYQGEPIVDNLLLANYLTPRMKKLGIKFPGFGWHSFRRLHLSLMNRNGMTLFDLRRQAGHADIRTTQQYIVDDMAQRTEAVNALPRLQLVKKRA